VVEELVGLQGKFWILQWSAVAMFVSLCFVEGAATKRSITEKPPKELVTDAFYWFLSPYFRVASQVFIAGLLIAFGLLVGNDDPTSFMSGWGPLSRQPFWLMLLETLVLGDFCSYWVHRVLHRSALLWRIHAVHHSAKTIRWSTVGRVHPLNELVNYCMGVLPCIAIGLPVKAVIAVIPVMMWWAVLVHSDFKTAFGPLRKVLVSPQFHRWHHTHSQEGGSSNFGNFFALWDWMFGTHYLPSDRRPEVFGLDVDDMPEGYFGQLLYPFGATRPAEEQQPVLSSRPASSSRS
jgi:sterol desaturase/sphingolipid hydroxylase (fatty acid hydroxylase superfamily)